MILPPGSLSKISVITRNTRPGPFWTSTSPAKAEGIITKPAKTAAAISMIDTGTTSDLRLLLLRMLTSRVVKITQPIPIENNTYVVAWANTEKLNLLKSGRK